MRLILITSLDVIIMLLSYYPLMIGRFCGPYFIVGASKIGDSHYCPSIHLQKLFSTLTIYPEEIFAAKWIIMSG